MYSRKMSRFPINATTTKAANIKIWDAIKKSYDEDGTVEGVISNRVKGGFSVDIGVQAFLPGSQADLRPIRNLDELVGQTFEFREILPRHHRSGHHFPARVRNLDQSVIGVILQPC